MRFKLERWKNRIRLASRRLPTPGLDEFKTAYRTFSTVSGVLIVLKELVFFSHYQYKRFSIRYTTWRRNFKLFPDCTLGCNNQTALRKVATVNARKVATTNTCSSLFHCMVVTKITIHINDKLRPLECTQPHSRSTNGRCLACKWNQEVRSPHPVLIRAL